MVEFYKRTISAWMDGTESLDDGEYRVYDVVCNLMYMNDGPIVLHESGIAGRCNQHPLKFRRNLQKLVDKGKLILGSDGKITNRRVMSELEKISGKRSNPRPTPSLPPPLPGGDGEGVAGGGPGGSANKPLKTKEPTLFGASLEKRREEKSTEAKASASKPMSKIEIERKQLFDRGKEVLGIEAGGMIQNLLAVKHGNIALARSAIEQASTMDNPRQYVGGILRGAENGANRNGGGKLGYAGLAEQIRRGSRSGASADDSTAFFGDAGAERSTGGPGYPATGVGPVERNRQTALPPPAANRR